MALTPDDAASISVPLEVYLQSDYEPDAEYVDGVIEERAAAEDNHSAWQGAIAFWFWSQARIWGIRSKISYHVQTGPTRFRVPDVSVLDASLERERIAIHPPLAVFEILSPEDRFMRVMRKLGEYEAMGVSQIWVVNPDTNVCERFQNGHLRRSTEFSLPEKSIAFSLEEIVKLVL